MGVRREVGVDERRLVEVVRFNRNAGGLMHVRVRCRDESEQDGEYRNHGRRSTHHAEIYGSWFIPSVSSGQEVARYNRRMKPVTSVGLALVANVALLSVNLTLYAHEVTHTGTVIALKTAKYAQPNGGSREVRELEVTVVDPKTKKPSNRVFTITDKTKVTRAGKPVKVAEVTAQKDEKVAVVVDHDKPGDEAIAVRFEVTK